MPLPSGLPELVADEEYLARFLTSSSHFNAIMVKPSAFLPNPKPKNSSVFREENVDNLPAIWNASERDGTLHGVARFTALDVRAAGLDVLAEEPPARHANITGWLWNAEDIEMQRAIQREKAGMIAQKAAKILF